MITWIKAFLSGRSQRVVLDGEKSGACPVQSGVPQGSDLGRYLFLIYINVMPDLINSNSRLFADDTIMYLAHINQSDCLVMLSDISNFSVNWESEILSYKS